MVTAVIFDLDDTLYDEIEYVKSGFHAVAKHVAKKFPDTSPESTYQALQEQFDEGNRTKTFNAALDELGIAYDEDIIRELVTTYRNHRPNILLPKESRQILGSLSLKYILALLTDGFLPAQQLKVEALGIKGYFKCIIYTEELGRSSWKPSLAGFEKLLTIINTKPQQAVYVADNALKDFIAPNQMGMTTIQVLRPAGIHTSRAPDQQAEPGHAIRNLSELPDLLAKL